MTSGPALNRLYELWARYLAYNAALIVFLEATKFRNCANMVCCIGYTWEHRTNLLIVCTCCQIQNSIIRRVSVLFPYIHKQDVIILSVILCSQLILPNPQITLCRQPYFHSKIELSVSSVTTPLKYSGVSLFEIDKYTN